jgi:flagellar motor switch protein FliG
MPNREYQILNRKFRRTRYKRGIRPLRTFNRQLRDTKTLLTGKQKAAMLLMSLDLETATELLKGVDAEVAKELAVELSHLDAAGFGGNGQSLKLARQFCNSLHTNQRFHLKGFLKEILRSSIGEEKTEQVQRQIQELLYRQNPLIFIRTAESQTIASIIENEHPQTAAVVLSELPAKKVSEVLGFLEGGIRVSVVNRMGNCKTMTAEAKTRIADTVCRRLESFLAVGGGKALQSRSESSLRKVAVVLRKFGKEIREGLLGVIRGRDNKTGEMVANLMIVWEDISQITDRSLKKALRRVNVRKLALALVRADDQLIRKIKSNISGPMAAVLDEEAFLMSAYKKNDIEEAREEIVQVFREVYEKGELTFIEE